MVSQLMEPEVTLTDVIRRHLTMGLAIKDAFSAEQNKELSRFSKLSSTTNKSKQSKKKNARKSNLDDVTKDEVPPTIPFKTLIFLHAALKKHFIEAPEEVVESLENESRPCAYLHELLRGSSLHIPELPKPERNPELEARCQRLRLEQQEKAYQNMVSDVNASTLSTTADLASEYAKAMKTTSSALIVVFNVVLTVGAAFFFGFFAAKYSLPTPNIAGQALVGVVLATVVAAADLYFIIKTGL